MKKYLDGLLFGLSIVIFSLAILSMIVFTFLLFLLIAFPKAINLYNIKPWGISFIIFIIIIFIEYKIEKECKKRNIITLVNKDDF